MGKISHLLDPKNKEVARYCKHVLFGCNFYGETSKTETDKNQSKRAINLGSVLQSINVEILQAGKGFHGNEQAFMEYLEMAIKYRKPDHMTLDKFREKIMKDKAVFLHHLKSRQGKPFGICLLLFFSGATTSNS